MNSKNHKNGELAAEQHLSRVQQVYYWHEQTHKAPNIDSFLARLSLALGWQSKQLDCHSTVFHPNNPLCPTPRLLVHLQHCFLHVGGPHHFKAPCVGAPVGWQTAIAQLSRITLVRAKGTHVGEWLWLEWLLVVWTKGVTEYDCMSLHSNIKIKEERAFMLTAFALKEKPCLADVQRKILRSL